MADETRIEAIAAKLAADWQVRAAYETLAGALRPADLDEAYRAQAALQQRLTVSRGPIAGRKIALSSRAMQQMVGIDSPVAGAIFAGDLHPSGASIRAAGFRHIGLEYELAFELGADIAPGGAPRTPESLAGLIARVRPAFELVEDKAADYTQLDVLTLVADNAWCGGVVLGDPIEDWQALDLAALPAVLCQDGAEVDRATTGAAEPLGSLAWVLEHCGRRGLTLRAGEVVITGSVMRTRFPVAGQRFRYEVGGRWAVEVAID